MMIRLSFWGLNGRLSTICSVIPNTKEGEGGEGEGEGDEVQGQGQGQGESKSARREHKPKPLINGCAGVVQDLRNLRV